MITDQDYIAVRKWAFERMPTFPGDTSYSQAYFQATDQLVVYALTGEFPSAADFVKLPDNPQFPTAQTTSIENPNQPLSACNIAKIAEEAQEAETMAANAGDPPS